MYCSKCGEINPREFYPTNQSWCKKCWREYNKPYKAQWAKRNRDKVKIYQKRWYEKNKDKVYLYNKSWANKNREKVRRYIREWMANHPEVNLKNFKKWYSNHAEEHYERRLAYAQEDPQRHRAQCYAFREIPDTQICEVEGCFELGERHHDDYGKPLEIRWLCKKHHKELHKIQAKSLVV